jgi:hypothetical protein
MALSVRGRTALAYIDCEDIIVQNGISMRARMLHDLNCNKQAVPYGTRPEHVIRKNHKIFVNLSFIFKEIISIDRRILNELLLDGEFLFYSFRKIIFNGF